MAKRERPRPAMVVTQRPAPGRQALRRPAYRRRRDHRPPARHPLPPGRQCRPRWRRHLFALTAGHVEFGTSAVVASSTSSRWLRPPSDSNGMPRHTFRNGAAFGSPTIRIRPEDHPEVPTRAWGPGSARAELGPSCTTSRGPLSVRGFLTRPRTLSRKAVPMTTFVDRVVLHATAGTAAMVSPSIRRESSPLGGPDGGNGGNGGDTVPGGRPTTRPPARLSSAARTGARRTAAPVPATSVTGPMVPR